MGTLVLGIDGLGLEGVKALNRHGYFGDLKYYIDNYIAAHSVRTIFPPQTIPVWPSIFTGVNPGKHGVFSFFNASKLRLNTRLDVDFPYIYEIFMLNGRRVLVDNVPLSYPPILVRGVYFSDWLSPKNALIVNHESKNIVRDIASQYIFLDPSLRRRSWRLFSLAVSRYIRARRWVLNGLLEGNYFDDAFIVISEIDWMFHSFYNLFLLDTLPSFLKMPLKELDALIHDLLRIAEKKFSNIVIIADHGFHVYKELVFINEILRRFGLARGITLRFVSKKAKVRHIKSMHSIRDQLLENLLLWGIRIGIPLISPNRTYKLIFKWGIRPLPNPRKSLAFALLNIPAMFINVHPNIKDRVLKKLISKLSQIKINGKKVLSFAKLRNQLFSGNYTKRAPPIGIFGNISEDILLSPLSLGIIAMRKIINYHDFNPVFSIKSKNSLTRPPFATILDMASTLYALEEIPAPRGLDGENHALLKLKTKDYPSWTKLRALRKKQVRLRRSISSKKM